MTEEKDTQHQLHPDQSAILKQYGDALSQAYWEITDSLPDDCKVLANRPPLHDQFMYSKHLDPLIDIIGALYRNEEPVAVQRVKQLIDDKRRRKTKTIAGAISS